MDKEKQLNKRIFDLEKKLMIMDDTDRQLIYHVLFLYKVISYFLILFVFSFMYIFFGDIIDSYLFFWSGLKNLSEGWKIAIFVILAGIPAGVIVNVTSKFICNKFEIFKK